ncbi:MAG: glycosyltransferase [Muribaculaceae bacterium]|nr:glycosyltransferase [Muribaculaceae bacterium]
MISVIVPVYNGEGLLPQALESLRRQTYTDFEVIIVNDGSTDGSEIICRDFAESDSRFKLINQANAGVSTARNRGIEAAGGEWIAFMDADDVMPPDALEVLTIHASKSGADIIAGKYVRKVPKANPRGIGHSMTINADAAILIGLYQKIMLNSPCGVLYHKSVFMNDPKLFFRNCRYEDLDFFYQAFERVEKICITDRVVYYYRDTPGSFINKWSEARLDALDVTDRIVEHMKTRSPALYKAALDRRFSAHFNILIEMLRNGIDNPQQKERCLKVIKEQRLNELNDGKVRLKNKLGALISYPGIPVIKLLCKF